MTIETTPTPVDCAALRAMLAQPHRVAGRFAVVSTEMGVLTAPLVLARAPSRLSAAVGLRGRWPAPPLADAGLARLATAARQDLWRRLQRARGFAPAVLARWEEDGEGGAATVDAYACALDGAPAAPRAMDALFEIFQEDAVKRWTAWSRRARNGSTER